MKPLLLLGIVYCLGGASYPLLAWLLGYRRRMREQKREALLNRVIGATGIEGVEPGVAPYSIAVLNQIEFVAGGWVGIHEYGAFVRSGDQASLEDTED